MGLGQGGAEAGGRKQGRGGKLSNSPDIFSGLFWNGEEAVRQGLADGVGNLDFVARELVKAEEIIDYTPRGDGCAACSDE